MEAIDLKRRIVEWTLANAHIEERNYLGMSAIGHCPSSLFRDMLYGRGPASYQLKMFSYLGYLFEDDMKRRLAGIDASLLGAAQAFSEFGGRYQGHTDGEWDGDLFDVKSTTSDKITKTRQSGVPPSHYWQAQAYMQAGGYDRELIIYVARDDGTVYVHEVQRSQRDGRHVMDKVEHILQAVEANRPPACECGRCR